jgi:hypothetical protein
LIFVLISLTVCCCRFLFAIVTVAQIPQFLHYFPTLVETGINAQLDLVEDEKASIRLHAIRGLELICKHNPSTVRRIAEVLGQLLVSEDKLELVREQRTFVMRTNKEEQDRRTRLLCF